MYRTERSAADCAATRLRAPHTALAVPVGGEWRDAHVANRDERVVGRTAANGFVARVGIEDAATPRRESGGTEEEDVLEAVVKGAE